MTYKDIRGRQYDANCIEIYHNQPYYCGFLVTDLQQTEVHRSSHFYNIIGGETILGMIALNDIDVEQIKTTITAYNMLYPENNNS